MADEPNRDEHDEGAEVTAQQQEPKTSGKTPLWRRLLSNKWFAILVVATIVIQGAGFAYVRWSGKSAAATSSPEVSLGVFRFEADQGEVGRVASAKFSLHIALLDQVDQAARRRLEDRRFRVQQDVEQLLRRAHGGDFEDPELGELKRQLQERINETLQMRAISDVIITDLKLQHNGKSLGLVTDAAESVPWVDEPSS